MVRSAITIQHQEKLEARTIINRASIEHGMDIAEIGAGGGGHTVLPIAMRVGEEGHVYAIDVQKNMLEILESRANGHMLHNMDFIHANAEKINGTTLDSESVDRVIFVNTMHQMEEKGIAVKEASRILKPGGEVLIIDWGTKLGCPYPALESYCFDPHNIESEIKDAQLVHVDTFYVKPYYWGLLLRKNV